MIDQRRRSTGLAPARQRELQLAAAVAREKIAQFHVTSALRLIGLAGDRVSPMRMLEIHLRLHRLSGPEAEILAYRVLAALGEGAPEAAGGQAAAAAAAAARDDEASLFQVVRRRLRGRVLTDLRRQVELAAGAAQAGLVAIHVHHALRFTRELVGTHSIQQAASVYAEMVAMPATLLGAFQIALLDRLAGEELPRSAMPAPRERAQPDPPVSLLTPRTAHRQVS